MMTKKPPRSLEGLPNTENLRLACHSEDCCTCCPKANRSERGVKVLERPRREEVDTAAWQPDLVTDAEGKVHQAVNDLLVSTSSCMLPL